MGALRTRKIKKVTTSQDDGLVGVLKNISVGYAKRKKIKKVTTSRDDKVRAALPWKNGLGQKAVLKCGYGIRY
jgi:hypothetical protein